MTNQPTQEAPSSDVVEALDMAVELIQEAKGAEGPNGGFVTNHLDAAESHLERVRIAHAKEQHAQADRYAARIAELEAALGGLVEGVVREVNENNSIGGYLSARLSDARNALEKKS